tara:strand:+ start:33573 stop:35807 length:2235 start_codon:yes stop_codon:yes gene_type:complete
MGLFSSKTKITVDVVGTPVVEDKQDFTTNAVLKGVIGNTSVSDSLLEASTGGFYASVNQYFNRAKAKGSVSLPIARSLSGSASEADLKSAVTQYAGEMVVIEDIQTSGPIANSIALFEMDVLYGLDYTTKKTRLPIDPETDADYDCDYYFIGAHFEFSIETFEYNLLVIDYERVVPAVLDDDGNTVTPESRTLHTTELLMPDVSEDEAFLYVIFYALEDPEKRRRIWVYELSTNRYTGIEMFSAYQAHNYLPIVPIRRNKQNLTDRQGTEAFKQYSWMMDRLGLNLEEITDAIMNEDNGNDPEQIEEVFMLFAADIASEEPSTKKYLWEYFNNLSKYQYQTKTEFEAWLNNRTHLAPINLIEIVDNEFKYALAFNYIEVEDIYDFSYSTMFSSGSRKGEVKTKIVIGQPIPQYIDEVRLDDLETSKFIIEKVVNDNHIKRITVHGLFSMHEAYRTNELPPGQDNTFQEPGGYWVKRTLTDAKLSTTDPDNEDKGFYIPVAKNFVDKLPAIQRSELYQDTMNIIVYAVNKQKVKWYERGMFKVALVLVAIAVTYFTGDFTALSWATALSFVTNLVVNLIIGELISQALTNVVAILGIENAAILAAIASIVAFTTGRFNAEMAVSWADDLLKASMWGLQAVGKEIQNELGDLLSESETFFDMLQEKYDELEEIDEMLKGDTNIDYVYLQNQARQEIYIEDPSMFYLRTIHNSNPGVLSKDMISTYVDRKLKLPDINELTKLFKKNT